MADDPKPPAEDPKPPTKPEDALGDAGKKALDDERAARRDAEKQLKELQAQLKAFEDKDKSESDKLREQAAAAEKARVDAEAKVLRLEVAAAKGLTAVQARRLVGTTQEELEADADDLLASFTSNGNGNGTEAAPGKPKEDLKGGGDPTDEPQPDMREVIAKVPRGF